MLARDLTEPHAVTGDIADPQRRSFVSCLVAGALGVACAEPLLAATASPTIEVWTGPGCGCCKVWIQHLEEHGFDVTWQEGGNSDARARLGMPVRFGSCHTAEIEGYAIEGHVPASDIRELLKVRPDALGLSVPAMPRGSPGMDGPAYRGIRDPYDVLLVHHDGAASVFQSYR